ncbi:MAG TPA: GTP cyclohydrolase II, partial [Terriglobia bacterium]|nr:GTP cyclohydrolase II [Terriglobia bacterium]
NAANIGEAAFPTKYGPFRMHFGFESEDKSDAVIALVMGAPATCDAPLVRIHSQCLTGESLKSSRCDCGEQLEMAMKTIAEEGNGILIYQLQEGRGIGLLNKLKAYQLQDGGMDTYEANHHLGFEADHRNYALCAEVLRHLGVTRLRLMTNNPRKVQAVQDAGITMLERVGIEIPSTDDTQKYLLAKKNKLGHHLSTV